MLAFEHVLQHWWAPIYHPQQGHDWQASGGAAFLEPILQSPSFFPSFHKGDFGNPIEGKRWLHP
jgi:hypothetical protein